MRKAPCTGPGPLCRAAARVGKFGEIGRKASPCSSGLTALSPWGWMHPQLAWMFQWSSLWALVSPRAGAAQWSRMAASGEDAGRCRRRHKQLSSLEQEEDNSKSWKRKNGEEGRGGYPHTSQELSLLTARLWGCAESRRYTDLQSQEV